MLSILVVFCNFMSCNFMSSILMVRHLHVLHFQRPDSTRVGGVSIWTGVVWCGSDGASFGGAGGDMCRHHLFFWDEVHWSGRELPWTAAKSIQNLHHNDAHVDCWWGWRWWRSSCWGWEHSSASTASKHSPNTVSSTFLVLLRHSSVALKLNYCQRQLTPTSQFRQLAPFSASFPRLSAFHFIHPPLFPPFLFFSPNPTGVGRCLNFSWNKREKTSSIVPPS